MGKERNVPWEEILRRRKEGETARALAEEFGVSVESVYKRGQRERLEQRAEGQLAAGGPKAVPQCREHGGADGGYGRQGA